MIARLARDITRSFRPIDETNIFSTDSATIHLIFSVKGLAPGSRLEAVWIAERVEAEVPPGYEIDRSSLVIQRDSVGEFTLSKPVAGFPIGSYRVELYRDGVLIGFYPFTVN